MTDYTNFGVEGTDLSELADLKDDIDAIGSLFELGSPMGSPRRQDGSNAGSPGRHSKQQLNGGTTGGSGGPGFSDPQDEPPNQWLWVTTSPRPAGGPCPSGSGRPVHSLRTVVRPASRWVQI